jgi:hypothetical protein
MEKIKEPAMILSMVNSAGLVGVTAYFYKQIEVLRQDNNKVAGALQAILKKLTELEKDGQLKGEILHKIKDEVKEISEDLQNTVTVDTLDADLSELVAVLGEHEIPVELPSHAPPPPPPVRAVAARRGAAPASRDRSDRSERSERSERDDGKRASARQGRLDSTRDASRDTDTRSARREPRQTTEPRQERQDSRPAASTSRPTRARMEPVSTADDDDIVESAKD